MLVCYNSLLLKSINLYKYLIPIIYKNVHLVIFKGAFISKTIVDFRVKKLKLNFYTSKYCVLCSFSVIQTNEPVITKSSNRKEEFEGMLTYYHNINNFYLNWYKTLLIIFVLISSDLFSIHLYFEFWYGV